MATLTIADLDNGKRDLQTVDEVANSRAATATTRFGQQTTTLYESIRRINATGDEVLSNLGFRVPVPYTSGLNVTDSRFTVTGPDGKVYAPLNAPFTTSAWDPSQWYVLQNDLNDHKLLIFETLLSAQTAAAILPDGQRVQVLENQKDYSVGAGTLVFEDFTATSKLDGVGAAGPTSVVDWGAGGPKIRRPLVSTQDLSIFVDPASGNDAGPGSQSSPLKTITEALQRLPGRIFHKVRVYFLDGTYPASDCIKLFDYYVTARGRAGLRFVGHIATLDGEAHPIYTDTNPGAVVLEGPEHVVSGIRGTEELFFAGMTFKNGWYEGYDSYSRFVNCNFTGGQRSPGYSTYHALGGHNCNMDFINCGFSDLASIGMLTDFANCTFENCTLSGLHTTSDAANAGRPFTASNRSTIYVKNSPQLLVTGPGGKSVTVTGGEIFDFEYSPMGYAVLRRSTPDRDEALIMLGHDGGALGTGRGAGIELCGRNHPTKPGRATVEFGAGQTTDKFVVQHDTGGAPQEVASVSRYGEVTAKANILFGTNARALNLQMSDGQATFYTNATSGDVFLVSKKGGVMKYVRVMEWAAAAVLP